MAPVARALAVSVLGLLCFLVLTEAVSELAPIDCVVSKWKISGTCSTTPPYGRKISRMVVTEAANNGTACPVLTKLAKCKPEHCEMTKWSKWTHCSRHGTKTRTRSVAKQPKHGGRACPSRVDRVRCKPPPVNCTLDKNWSHWGPCELNATAYFVQNRTRGISTRATRGGSCPAGDAPDRLETKPCHPVCAENDTASDYDACVRVMAQFEVPVKNSMYAGTYTVVSESMESQWKCAASCVALSSCRAYSYQTTICLVSDGDVHEPVSFGPDARVASAMIRPGKLPLGPPE